MLLTFFRNVFGLSMEVAPMRRLLLNWLESWWAT